MTTIRVCGQTVILDHVWQPGGVLVGGATLAAVDFGLESNLQRCPAGVTAEQWPAMLDIVAYALNDGPMASSRYSAARVPSGILLWPAFSFRWQGGLRNFLAEQQHNS